MIKQVNEKIKGQINLFYLALSFFTRLPVPKTMQYSEELLNKANRYFSLVGLLIGAILAIVYSSFTSFLPINISILLTMIISLILTGAFHEDGLADMADGMGGGFTKDKKLEIMKDSRIGTYGSVTLVMTFLLKYTLLAELAIYDSSVFLLAIVLSEALSRSIAGSLISSIPYVTDNETSKSKPLAQAQSPLELFILLLFGVLPLLYFSVEIAVVILFVLVVFRWLFKCWLVDKIGGFTGDCLGAGQQISQLLIYITLVSFSYGSSSSSSYAATYSGMIT